MPPQFFLQKCKPRPSCLNTSLLQKQPTMTIETVLAAAEEAVQSALHVLQEARRDKSHTEPTQTVLHPSRIRELEAQVSKLSDENASFRKVSRIVYFENENARLRERIEHLEAQLEAQPVTKHGCDIGVGPDEVIEVYEKKIKGVLYYVSSTDGIVYTRLGDGSVGEDVGVLAKSADGRTRLVLRVQNMQ